MKKETSVAIKSHDYVHGVSGWALYKDGSMVIWREGKSDTVNGLSMPETETVGQLTYALKIDTSAAVEELEAFSKSVAESVKEPFYVSAGEVRQCTIRGVNIFEEKRLGREQFLADLTIAAVSRGMEPALAAKSVMEALPILFPADEVKE